MDEKVWKLEGFGMGMVSVPLQNIIFSRIAATQIAQQAGRASATATKSKLLNLSRHRASAVLDTVARSPAAKATGEKARGILKEVARSPIVHETRKKARGVIHEAGKGKKHVLKKANKKVRRLWKEVRRGKRRRKGKVGGKKRPVKVEKVSKEQLQRWEREVIKVTNESRRRLGIRAVKLNRRLCDVARRHNQDQMFVLRKISHTGSDGTSVGDRLIKGGYDFGYAVENLAVGQENVKHVHQSLMRSRGHRRNLLKKGVREMGVHVGRGRDGRLYWTQVLARTRQ